MKILSLKRSDDELSGKVKAYEIAYKANDETGAQNISIPIESDYGTKIDEAAKLLVRGQLTQAEMQELIIEAVEENTAVVVDKMLNELSSDKNTEAISARIKLIDGSVLKIDDKVIDSALTGQLMSMIKARRKNRDSVKNEDWLALVNFTEALYSNTNEYIRNQLYAWLTYQIKNGRLTLTPDGHFLGYKGVKKEDGDLLSIHSGPGFVNGELCDGHLNNNPGNVLEMVREDVDDNPDVTCSTGLHVGSYDYADSFSQGAVILVDVDPRDVVSVPYDYNGQKIRVCKYKVIKEVEDELGDFSLNFENVNSDTENIEAVEVSSNIHTELSIALLNDTKISFINYTTKSGDYKTYYDVTVLTLTDSIVKILTEGNYKTLLIDNIQSLATMVSYENSQEDELTATDPYVIGKVLQNSLDNDVEISIDYVKKSGEKTHFDDCLVKEIENGKVVVILSDGGIRTLFKDKITEPKVSC